MEGRRITIRYTSLEVDNNVPRCFYIFLRKEMENILSVAEHIRELFAIPDNLEVELFIDDICLPPRETSLLLKEDEVVDIKTRLKFKVPYGREKVVQFNSSESNSCLSDKKVSKKKKKRKEENPNHKIMSPDLIAKESEETVCCQRLEASQVTKKRKRREEKHSHIINSPDFFIEKNEETVSPHRKVLKKMKNVKEIEERPDTVINSSYLTIEGNEGADESLPNKKRRKRKHKKKRPVPDAQPDVEVSCDFSSRDDKTVTESFPQHISPSSDGIITSSSSKHIYFPEEELNISENRGSNMVQQHLIIPETNVNSKTASEDTIKLNERRKALLRIIKQTIPPQLAEMREKEISTVIHSKPGIRFNSVDGENDNGHINENKKHQTSFPIYPPESCFHFGLNTSSLENQNEEEDFSFIDHNNGNNNSLLTGNTGQLSFSQPLPSRRRRIRKRKKYNKSATETCENISLLFVEKTLAESTSPLLECASPQQDLSVGSPDTTSRNHGIENSMAENFPSSEITTHELKSASSELENNISEKKVETESKNKRTENHSIGMADPCSVESLISVSEEIGDSKNSHVESPAEYTKTESTFITTQAFICHKNIDISSYVENEHVSGDDEEVDHEKYTDNNGINGIKESFDTCHTNLIIEESSVENITDKSGSKPEMSWQENPLERKKAVTHYIKQAIPPQLAMLEKNMPITVTVLNTDGGKNENDPESMRSESPS